MGKPPSPEAMTELWGKSPCAHVSKVSAPTLIALGLKDRRVPPSQGMEYYYALRARGVQTRLLCYEEEGHALDGAAADADHWINVALWFREHLEAPSSPSPLSLARECSVRSVGV